MFLARTTRGRLTPIACAIAIGLGLALAIAASGGCGAGSARGPPIPLHSALARARQALCQDRGVESPAALVARLGPEVPCPSPGVRERVRCYLARPDSTVQVARVAGGYRFWFAMPALSDHVHEVAVRRGRDALMVEVHSRN